MKRLLAFAFAFISFTSPLVLADAPSFDRKQDVVYGRKFGTALTLDVFTPTNVKPNGAGVIVVVSGGWYSSHDGIPIGMVKPFTDRGYTAFAVVHGSQPRFTIPEAVADMNRAVRFIRTHSKEYHVDPDRLGIVGSSAGGHLSLMIGTAGAPGKPDAADPVERASSRVAAVACFFPPTDFLNYGKPGVDALGRGILADFKAPFDFQVFDPKLKEFVDVDEDAKKKIGRDVSPANHVSSDDPPTLIIHGDADKLVPIQQSELIVEKLKAAGVKAALVSKPGASHGWPGLEQDILKLADWLDQNLTPKEANSSPTNSK